MSSAGMPLAVMMALVTAGEQVRLGRTDRPQSVALCLAGAYGVCAFALTGGAAAAAAVAGLCAVASWCAERALSTRGPSLWSAVALVAAPYVAVWLVWAALRPTGLPAAVDLLTAVAGRLGPAGAGAHLVRQASILVSAYTFCWGTGTFLTRSVLGGYAAHGLLVPPRSPSASAVAQMAAAVDPGEQGLLRAGRLIGELERFLTLTLALTGDFTAIAFVVTAKSIARFDLARRHGEYFLVGTLCSIGTALMIGVLAARLLRG